MLVDPEQRSSSLGFPNVHISPYILCYLHLYLFQREKQGFGNVEVLAWESLFFVIFSSL